MFKVYQRERIEAFANPYEPHSPAWRIQNVINHLRVFAAPGCDDPETMKYAIDQLERAAEALAG
jgi:hypothetical protein